MDIGEATRGERVGQGRTSDVFAYGADSVIKVPHLDVPDAWPMVEATLTRAVADAGVRVPAVRDVIDVGDRRAVVFERISGPSMWQQMMAAPREATALARDLADIHSTLLAIGLPTGLPDLVDRMQRKIAEASALDATERDEAEALADALPRGAALLHGDLHPGNVLMGADGPVVIDWFDAAIGHPVADIVRSSLLMRPGERTAPTHLPGASAELLSEVHQQYLRAFAPQLTAALDDLPRWQAAVAASRLSEGAEGDESVLISWWGARSTDPTGREIADLLR